MGKKLTTQEREQIEAFLKEGKSTTEIAKLVERSPGSVQNVAKAAGHAYGKTNLQNAHARAAYCAEARERIRAKLYQEAEQIIDDLRKPHLVYSFGGKENEFNSKLLDIPDAKARRDLLTSLGIAVDKAELIERNNANAGDDGRGAMLALLEAMGVQVPRPA